ncbi:MAG TPA: hypothetical protein VK306_09275 [Acidimicrobiales bacterium]|nr:hypothetical protein [Acidimicrobiales bacterium]
MRVGPSTARDTFADAQERHRRAGRRISVLGVMAVVIIGLPLSVVVSPLAVAVAVIAIDLVNLVVPMPDLGELANDAVLGLGDPGPAWHVGPLGLGWIEGLVGATALLAPGVVLMVTTWRCVRRLFLRAGPEALVLAAAARPPEAGDLEERQLANLVDEMAIAAGISPPRVLVVDGDHANAAVVGRSIDDAVLLLPRGLLDDLGRGPTGAVVADLLALVLDGDLGVALHVASVMQTLDLVGAVLAAPTNRRTRAVLWRVGRFGLRRGRTGDPDEAQFIVDHLAALGRGDADLEPAGGCLAGMAQLPFLVGSLTFQLTRMGPGRLLLDPLLGSLWRRRRLLADATAVQLTRDPGALARALAYLDERGAGVPEGPWPHLFLVGPSVGPSGGRSGAEPVVAGGTAHAELVTFLPPLAERLRRLHAMGARPDVDPGVPVPAGGHGPGGLATLARAVRHAVMWPARLVAVTALLALTACLVYLSLILDALFLAPLVVLVHAMLR